MSQLTNFPRQDAYETQLDAELSAAATTGGKIKVKLLSDATIDSSNETTIIVNPGLSTMEAISINAKDTGTNEYTILSRALPLYTGHSPSPTTHARNSEVVISDNHNFWSNIATAVNSKFDSAGGTISGATDITANLTVTGADAIINGSLSFTDVLKAGLTVQNLTTAQITALTPATGNIVYDTDVAKYKFYEGTEWITIASDAELAAHLADLANPHQVTKAQVGLSLVENYDIASLAEAQAGTATDKYMTPQRVAQYNATLVDRLGFENVTSTTYNSSGLISQIIADGTTYDLTYNNGGQLLTANDGTFTFTMTYAANGDLSLVTKS